VTGLLSFRYARTVLYLVAVLLAFLVIVDVLILSQQRRYFRDEARGLVEHDVELVGMLLGRELLGAGYDRAAAERVLAGWMEEHPDVVELRASTPEGGVLAEVSRETAHRHLFHVEHAVRYGENGLFSLEMVRNITPLERSLRNLSLGLVLASVLIAGMMGAVLWLAFKKTTIRPLELEIAERRRAEEALRESEEKFRAIFDYAMDGIALAGAESNRVFLANETLCRMLGYSHDELRLMSLMDMHPVGCAPRVAGGPGRGKGKVLYSAREIPVKRKDGSLFYANVTGAPVSLGGKEYVMGIFRDVTDRRRAEEALRESEGRYRTFVHNFHGIAFMGNMDFVPVFFHGAVEEITGYAESDFIAGAPKWDQVIHEDDMPLILDSAEKLRGVPDTSISREYRIVRKDGGVRWVFEVIHNVCDDSGMPSHVEGAIYDITKRKRAEEALMEAEEKFRAIFDNAKDGIALADAESKEICLANETYCRMLGYSHDELMRITVMDLHTEADLPYVLDIFRKVAGGEVFSAPDVPVKRKDGSVFHADATGAPVTLGGREYLIGIFRDVTDRKRAEEALRESETSHRTLAGNLPGIVYRMFLEEGSRMQFFNDMTYPLTGYSPEELEKGDVCDLEHLIFPEDRERVKSIVNNSVRDDEPFEVEYRIRHIGGETRYFYEKGRPVRGAEGKPAYIDGFVLDVTERKRTEEFLRSALREKEVLLNEVHHRVKNNLTVVSSLVSLQRRRIGDREIQGFFMDMESRIRSIAMVHENLYQARDLANINFGNYLNSLAATIFRFYDMPPTSVGLKLDVPPELCFDVSTMVPCGLILNELVTNALKYAFPGGQRGELSISLGPEDEGRYTLAVRDNGVGLPEGLDVRNAESLGLRLVGLLTEQLDGDLDVVSEGGTEFRITFKAN
jgi:PAS domain S-box-containing protein